MDIYDYIVNTFPITAFELLAAIAGTYYISKVKTDTRSKFLVSFLWLNFIIEVFGMYAPIAYFTDYEYFGFVQGTPFRGNNWLYNIFFLISFSFYTLYFRSFLRKSILRRSLLLIVGFYLVSGMVHYITSDVFFKAFSKYTTILGAFVMFFSIVLFFLELLRSEVILKLKRFLPFYIALGIFVFTLCITPLNIFMEYFYLPSGNDLFVSLRANIYLYANIFMYSLYIIGFIICSRKTPSSY